MASRILTCVSCTSYFCILIIITIIGFVSLIVGAVGVGLYVPTSQNYQNYKNNTCFIIEVESGTCVDSCYYVMWSVEYRISYGSNRKYKFSTIRKTFDTLKAVTREVSNYADHTNHSCYYDRTEVARVQWTRPQSPRPYLIMLIVGFSITGTYMILLAIFFVYRLCNPKKTIVPMDRSYSSTVMTRQRAEFLVETIAIGRDKNLRK